MGRGQTQSARTGKSRGYRRTLPAESGTYRVALSALDGADMGAPGSMIQGRVENIRAIREANPGVRLDPITVSVDAQGKASVVDGRSRLTVAREAGDTAIDVRVEVKRGRGTWASRKKPRRS
jgi:hypothetical protein